MPVQQQFPQTSFFFFFFDKVIKHKLASYFFDLVREFH